MYRISGNGYDEIYIENDNEVLEWIEDHLDEQIYDNMLDEVYGDIKICGYEYSASLALYRVDEVAYRCGRNDYFSSLVWDDLEYEMRHGGIVDFYGFSIEELEEDEEEEEE